MIYLGADHAGYTLKEAVKRILQERGVEYTDLGTDSEESVDFPDYAFLVGEKVAADNAAGSQSLGVLVCGSGGGMAVAANKVRGVKAVQVLNTEMAADARVHDDANVIILAGRYTSDNDMPAIIDAFMNTPFDAAERRVRRMNKIMQYEQEHIKE